MKRKKFYLYGLIVLFVLVVLALLFVTFSIKDVKITYSISEREEETKIIQQEIDSLKGKNLIFMDREEVDSIVENYPYFEIEVFEKSFPSTLNIKLKERQQIFTVKYQDKYAVISNEGIVLELVDSKKEDLIEIDLTPTDTEFFSQIVINECVVGSKLKTNFDEYFNQAVIITTSNESTDVLSNMKVLIDQTYKTFDLEYLTKTQISIMLVKAQENGVEKMDKAIAEYNNQIIDYKKSSEKHQIYVNEINGKIESSFIEKS